MPLGAVFHLAYQNPPACLAGSVCGVDAANGVSASLTGVFCGMVNTVAELSHLPFGVCSALVLSHQVFPFAARGPGICTHLDSMAFEAQFYTGCLVS